MANEMTHLIQDRFLKREKHRPKDFTREGLNKQGALAIRDRRIPIHTSDIYMAARGGEFRDNLVKSIISMDRRWNGDWGEELIVSGQGGNGLGRAFQSLGHECRMKWLGIDAAGKPDLTNYEPGRNLIEWQSTLNEYLHR